VPDEVIDTGLCHAEKEYQDRLNTSRLLNNENERIWFLKIQGLMFSTATMSRVFPEEPSGFRLSRPFLQQNWE